ncbi:IclR family transcriptional regulator [Mycobacterium sp. 852013-50091_SCH5140682]|uniref:IclR family transcriptional regulator n=1 Tax=Mycobacterium sp. 852013-50091_SCH5140682 TaxID=1834109 RepID=UPI0007EA812B|nr:IclR family transcriptional regulator [Mycobacterium sp. 852013-50091_SCH5140682]OBC00051.1 IclR family transcriptional regulator [Mycobacterium sp. 852013-50091_SCH5140682]
MVPAVKDSPDTPPIAAIGRVSALLDAFDGGNRLTLAQIARRTGLPRSSTHRMLDQLVRLQWLLRTGHEYELGTKLIELGHRAVHQNRVYRAAAPYLWDLHRATGMVVHLAILDGADVVYLEKVGGRMGLSIPTQIGSRQPAHCTGVGKAILAYSPLARLERLEEAELTRKTNYSITDAAELRVALSEIRTRGVAFDREECTPGFGCVAAPVGPVDEPVAAVSVCGPVDRLPFDNRLAAPVRITALQIWRNLDDAALGRSGSRQRSRKRTTGPNAADHLLPACHKPTL